MDISVFIKLQQRCRDLEKEKSKLEVQLEKREVDGRNRTNNIEHELDHLHLMVGRSIDILNSLLGCFYNCIYCVHGFTISVGMTVGYSYDEDFCITTTIFFDAHNFCWNNIS